MKAVKDFLKKNGFEEIDDLYANDKCAVVVHSKYYQVVFFEDGGCMCSEDLNIYWLIGVLTYYGLLNKNYNP